MKSLEGGKTSRSSRDRVVLPEDEGPDMPTRRGDDMVVFWGVCEYDVRAARGCFHHTHTQQPAEM